jgi:hypothetical protein
LVLILGSIIDYNALIGKGHIKNTTNEKIDNVYYNAHLNAQIFESTVVSDYFQKSDGTPVKLETAGISNPSLPNDPITIQIITFGILQIEYTYNFGDAEGMQPETAKVHILLPSIKKK